MSQNATLTMSGAVQGLAALQSVIEDLTLILASFAKSMASVMDESARLAAAVLDAAKKTTISTDALQAWAHTAKNAGVDAATVLKDIGNLGARAQEDLLELSEKMKGKNEPDYALSSANFKSLYGIGGVLSAT